MYFLISFLVLGLCVCGYAGTNSEQIMNKEPSQQKMDDLEGYEDDGYDDDNDGYDDFEEDAADPKMPSANNAGSIAPPSRSTLRQELPEDMGYEAPEALEAPRSGFRMGGGNSGEPERLDSGRPPEVMPQAPLPNHENMQAPIQPTDYDAPYKEGEVLARREHPPVQPEPEFGQTDWNQIDLHSLTRKRVDRF